MLECCGFHRRPDRDGDIKWGKRRTSNGKDEIIISD
jgi:hypothetical protein